MRKPGKKLKVLIGCECSGTVRRAFRALGHDAWSCDLLPADDGSEFHIQGDILRPGLLDGGWDLAIFHPPCTFLSVSGIHWNDRGRGWERTNEALEFVRKLMAAPIPCKVLENPVSLISSRIRKPDQIIQPYDFGDDASKKTCFWLEGLPPLESDPLKRVSGRMVEWPKGSGKMVERWSNQTDSGQNKLPPSKDRGHKRSITYPGVALAMAEQWGRTG